MWNLSELTDKQRAIIQEALSRCDFDFSRLGPGLKEQTGKDAIPVEFADLSRYAARPHGENGNDLEHIHVSEGGDKAHGIAYRHRVLGLFWYSGRVSIERTLENEPELAGEVFLSEAAHAVDVFSLTPEQRHAIWEIFHEGVETDEEHDQHHGWFDVPFSDWVGEPW